MFERTIWMVLAATLACTGRETEAPVDATRPGSPAQPRLQVAAGLQSTCAVLDGQVFCWGYNGHGELGDGTRADRRAPAAVLGVSDAVAVVLGAWHACALRRDGTVMCWGDATSGQIGDGGGGTRTTPVVVGGLADVTALSAGDTRTCALRQGGEVWCWGDRHGDVDDASGSARPRRVAGIRGATAIAARSGYACAVVEGRVRCWGQPPLPDGLIVEVAAGQSHACARGRDGRVSCWGSGREGQRGDGVFDATPERWHGPHPPPAPRAPQKLATVRGLTDVVRIAAGSDYSCALELGGALRCWGADRDGQLGDGGDAPQATPVVVPLAAVADMSLGSAHACAVLRDGDARCWGYNDVGQADNAAPGARLTPYVVFSAPVPTDRSPRPVRDMSGLLAASGRHACAIDRGAVECLGDNSFGQLGDGTWTSRATPVRVPGVVDAVQVITGPRHTCVRRATGEVLCWGDDSFGQLGQPGQPVGEPRDEHGVGPAPTPPRERSRPTPVVVAGLTGARQLAVQGHHTCALQDAGVLRCWHGAGAAALAEPMQLPRDTVEVGLGAVHSCARRAGGEVLCWGLNFYGRIGDGTRVDRPQPTPVTGLTDATGLALGQLHSCALRRGGAVGCWGSGADGRLGDGAGQERPGIVAVEGLRDIEAIVAGADHSCALDSRGKVHCWGSNDAGALGDGTSSARLVPVEVTGLERAAALAAGEQLSCAQLPSAAVQCWGRDLRAPDEARTWAVARAPAVITGLPAPRP